MELEGRGQVLVAFDDVVRGQLAKACFGNDQDHRAQLFAVDQHADDERVIIA